jgi:alkanesulfonate monooxygenase SsuD/methylene tetrahydromethanopterin reductase-like flavin-dependent oxidoreductase (luciferase family)
MKLTLQLGYWGAHSPTDDAELITAAEEAGFDTVFTAARTPARQPTAAD